MIGFKERIIYNKPLRPSSNLQTTSDVITHDFNTQMKLMHEKQLDTMAEEMLKLEKQSHEYNTILNDEVSTMWKNHQNSIEGKIIEEKLSDLITERSNNIIDQWRQRYIFRRNYYLLCPFGDWDAMDEEEKNEMVMNRNDVSTENIGFQPHIFMDTTNTNLFNREQLKLLNRGPTYVPPCQMRTTSSSIDSILQKQYAPFKHQLAALFNKYKLIVNLQLTIQKHIYQQFKVHFSEPIPEYLQKRAIYEKKLVGTITRTLTKNNLILRRTADNMNTFYLGYRLDFEYKINSYLNDTNNYELYYTVNEDNDRKDLLIRVKVSTAGINDSIWALKRRKDIDDELHKRLLTNVDQVKLSYLYFLPDISNVSQKSIKLNLNIISFSF